jgi:hypothetical protein
MDRDPMRPVNALVLVLALTGCAGGQTGGSGIPAACEYAEPVPINSSEVTAAGFSVAQVLSFAEGTHSFEAAWPHDGEVPATGTLVVTAAEETARFIDAMPPAHLDLPENPCAPRVEQDVSVALTLSNEHGTLAATFDSVLVASSSELAQLSNIELTPEIFTGALQWTVAPDERVSNLQVLATISPLGASGVLYAVAISDPQLGEVDGPVAAWPAGASCGPRDHAVGIDQTLFGVMPGEVVTMLPQALTLAWDDGERTTATLALTPRNQVACLTKDCDEWCPALIESTAIDPETRSRFELEVTAAIVTADGRWDGTFDAVLYIEVLDVGGLERTFLHAQSDHASAQALEDDLGLRSVAGDGPLSMALLVQYASAGADAPLQGSLSVLGALEPEACEPPGRMCAGGATGTQHVAVRAGIEAAP